MGRYATLTTNTNESFEYKFWFAVQNSSDIREFGGDATLLFNEDDIVPYIDSEDQQEAWDQLKAHLDEINCIDFNNVTDEISENYWFGNNQWLMDWSKDKHLDKVRTELKMVADHLGWSIPEDLDEDEIEEWMKEQKGYNTESEHNAKFYLGFIIYAMLKKSDTLHANYEC